MLNGRAGPGQVGQHGRVQRIHGVADVADRYDVVLCDVWGVVHDGRAAFPEAVEALQALRERGVVVVLLSNASRLSRQLPELLAQVGVPEGTWDAIVTSGDVARSELARRSPGPVHRLGREGDDALWAGLGLEFTGLSSARFVAMAGLAPGDEPADYDRSLRRALVRDLELVIANPDVQVQLGDQLVWCPGAVARRYVAMGGRTLQAGKPFAPIYQRARDEAQRVSGTTVEVSRMLAIGDGIGTDLLGANRVGLDSLFIATGVNGAALLSNGYLDVARAQAALEAAHVRATWAMSKLS
jgi:HAD superfamily hydrolase (TIGR01459 family)